jgi:hypothetical protein
MGIYYSVHLGPYIICDNPLVDSVSKRRSCTDPQCRKYKHSVAAWDEKKFCDACGTPIGEVEYPDKKSTVDVRDFMGSDFEDLYLVPHQDKEVDLWTPNMGTKPGERKFCEEPNEDRAIEVTADMIKTETSEFINRYKKLILLLQEKYGQLNVKVTWGLVQYGS